MSQGSRPNRVGDQVRAELADLLTREVHDPGIGFVTLTRVQVSPDLQVARVYYTALGDDAARRRTTRALDRAAPFLRRRIGARLRLRRVPELTFVYDDSIAGQDRIEQILNEIHSSALSHPADEDEVPQSGNPQAPASDPTAPASSPTPASRPAPASGPPRAVDDGK